MIEREVPILFFANKSDLEFSMSAPEVANGLGLDNITDRPWHIQACSAITGDGIDLGMNWMTQKVSMGGKKWISFFEM